MKKLFKKLALMVVALLTFSVGSNYTVKEVRAADEVVTYTFSNYTAGTQYAKNEEHVMDENLTIYTTDCHFTTQLRIYSSSTNDGYVILKSTKKISALGFNMGNKKDTLGVYGSDDNSEWTAIGTVATTTTSYKDYAISFTAPYSYVKLDVTGASQIRIASLTVTYINDSTGGEDTPIEPSYPESVTNYVTSISVNETYKLGFQNTSNIYYFNGEMTNKYYGATTTNFTDGVFVNLEETTNGYFLYFVDLEGNKLYINVVQSGDYINFKYDSTATSTYVFDTTYFTLVTSLNSVDYVLGSEGTYNTFSAYEYESIESDSIYVANLYSFNMVNTTAALGFDYTYDETNEVKTGYSKVSNASELKAGDIIIIVCETKNVVLSAQGTNTYRTYVSTTISNDFIKSSSSFKDIKLVEYGTTDDNLFYLSTDEGYLCYEGSKNTLTSKDSFDDSCIFSITTLEGITKIIPSSDVSRSIQYNVSSPRFACYAGTQEDVSVFIKTEGEATLVKDFSNSQFDNISILFGAKVDSEFFSGYTNVSAGLLIAPQDGFEYRTLADAVAYNDLDSCGALKIEDKDFDKENGYSVGAVLSLFENGTIVTNSEVDINKLTTKFKVAVYFVVDGTVVVLQDKIASVHDLVNTYISDYADNENVKAHLEGLNAFDAFIEAK